MSSQTPKSSVSVILVRCLKTFAEKQGIDFAAIAGNESLNSVVLQEGRKRISAQRFLSLWHQIAAVIDDPHPGMSFGKEVAQSYPGGNLLFTMMMNCTHIGSALDMFVRYHRIVSDIIEPQIHREDDYTYLTWQPNMNNLSLPDFADAVLTLYSAIVNNLSQGMIHPLEVHFRRSRPEDISVYERVFQSPLIFAAEKNQLVIASTGLAIELDSPNLDVVTVLEKHAAQLALTISKETAWSNRTSRVVDAMLRKGIQPNIGMVAQKLALSRRNLQLKLQDEKTTYRSMLERVRKQIAQDYLVQPNVALNEVAFLLGYSEQSAFNHAFKRWTDKSPQEYRDTYFLSNKKISGLEEEVEHS